MQARRSRVYGDFWPLLAAVWESQGGLGWVFARTLVLTGTNTPEEPTNVKIPLSQIVKGPPRRMYATKIT